MVTFGFVFRKHIWHATFILEQNWHSPPILSRYPWHNLTETPSESSLCPALTVSEPVISVVLSSRNQDISQLARSNKVKRITPDQRCRSKVLIKGSDQSSRSKVPSDAAGVLWHIAEYAENECCYSEEWNILYILNMHIVTFLLISITLIFFVLMDFKKYIYNLRV